MHFNLVFVIARLISLKHKIHLFLLATILYSIYVLLEINQGHSNGNSVLSNIYTTILQGDQFVDDGY